MNDSSENDPRFVRIDNIVHIVDPQRPSPTDPPPRLSFPSVRQGSLVEDGTEKFDDDRRSPMEER